CLQIFKMNGLGTIGGGLVLWLGQDSAYWVLGGVNAVEQQEGVRRVVDVVSGPEDLGPQNTITVPLRQDTSAAPVSGIITAQFHNPLPGRKMVKRLIILGGGVHYSDNHALGVLNAPAL